MSPTWYREWFNRLVRYFRKHTRYAEMAPDLAQEALAAFASKDLGKVKNAEAYLLGIAGRMAAEQRLQELREQQTLESLPAAEGPSFPTDLSQSPAPFVFERALQRALSKLDTRSYYVLMLAHIGCTYEEIGDATFLTPNQVRHNLRDTRALLRALLRDEPTERR